MKGCTHHNWHLGDLTGSSLIRCPCRVCIPLPRASGPTKGYATRKLPAPIPIQTFFCSRNTCSVLCPKILILLHSRCCKSRCYVFLPAQPYSSFAFLIQSFPFFFALLRSWPGLTWCCDQAGEAQGSCGKLHVPRKQQGAHV